MIVLEILFWLALFVLVGILILHPMLLAIFIALTWYEYKKLPDDCNSSQNSDTEN